MWELSNIVVPRIGSHWKDLAYCMRYSIEDVEGFDRDGRSLHECCLNLFRNWIRTGHGPTPKTYQTLLEHIKKIDNLTAVSEEVKRELTKGTGQINNIKINTGAITTLYHFCFIAALCQ